MLVVAIGTTTPSAVWADHSRLQIIRSKQAEWETPFWITLIFIAIPELKLSQCEIIQLLVSQPIQIAPERPLQATILRHWDLINELLPR